MRETFAPPEDATNEEKLAFLSTICRVGIASIDGTERVGCLTCPPFEGPDARPDGTIATKPEQLYSLRVLKFGAFTAPGAEEASATFDGCESHAANYGGTLLARRVNGKWAAVRYDSAVHPDACRTHRLDHGRDILLCSWTDAHQMTAHAQVLAYDFNGADLDARWQAVVSVNDHSYGGCFFPPDMKVSARRIAGFGMIDEDGGKVLAVDVDFVEGEPNARYKQICEAQFRGVPDGAKYVDPATELGAMGRYRLLFLHTPSGFVPTEETKRSPAFPSDEE